MSYEYMAETPMMARYYCPTCEPNVDRSLEIVDIRWCGAHSPQVGGAQDGRVVAQNYMSGSTEAGGPDNRAWCDFFHRGKV